ncbi:MAG: hypothetical protein AMJ46_12545 [Latescibacteria bacterium DG_63]|nr:MAG: hypothetical protein AMJ46_12545 [Latescibacteria bacterium DG_63]
MARIEKPLPRCPRCDRRDIIRDYVKREIRCIGDGCGFRAGMDTLLQAFGPQCMEVVALSMHETKRRKRKLNVELFAADARKIWE